MKPIRQITIYLLMGGLFTGLLYAVNPHLDRWTLWVSIAALWWLVGRWVARAMRKGR